MKALWTILAVVAVANLLALAGFAGFLYSTKRLNVDRVRAIRVMLSETIEQEQARLAAEKAEADRLAAEAAERERMAQAPRTAADTLVRQESAEEVRTQQMLRRARELQDLRNSLMTERDQLTRDQKALVEREKAFEEYRKRLAEIEGTEQFRKALATLEGQKAADAKSVLEAMIADQKVDQVVTYLSAMEDRQRNRVMAEFVKDGGPVAADLLERLRTRGLGPTPSTPGQPASTANGANAPAPGVPPAPRPVPVRGSRTP